MRAFCYAIIVYKNENIAAPWVATGCMWNKWTPGAREDMRQSGRAWTREGYRWRLEWIELRSSCIVIHTHHLRVLQRAWRRQWRKRVMAWIHRRAYTGEHRPLSIQKTRHNTHALPTGGASGEKIGTAVLPCPHALGTVVASACTQWPTFACAKAIARNSPWACGGAGVT